MKILFLDDCPERREQIQKWLPDVTTVESAPYCIQAMQKKAWDVVFLDYDLGRLELTGGFVAQWMAEAEIRPGVDCVIIHSRNIAGSRMMEETLTAAGYKVRQVSWSDMPECLTELMLWVRHSF